MQEIQNLKEMALKRAPDGKIHVVKSKNRVQYYLRMEAKEKSGTYLPKTNPSIIQTYLQKSYDEKVLKIITKEIESLDKFLEKSESSVENIRQFYSSNPEEIKSYINPIDCSTEDYIKKWLSIPYEGKKILGNLPTYVTDKGEQVRSKSELNIANAKTFTTISKNVL